MASIDSVTLEVTDPEAARRFYSTAFGLGSELRLQAADAPTGGFRGFTVSLLASGPATVSALVDSAVSAGAATLKPAAKSFWGFGGVVQAPDGTIWKVATSNKRDKGPATREIDRIVLLLGCEDVKASKRFYVERGLDVAKSFGGRYVEFDMPSGTIGLGLYGRRALAKDAGVPPEGSGSHRLIVGGDAGTFTDPDGFAWQSAAAEGERAASDQRLRSRQTFSVTTGSPSAGTDAL
jgi:catechol 2,3-dioxygenase-like lactoylglutathione lyase family enzyme